MSSKYLDKILSEVSLDERVSDGTFNIEEDRHMEALRDYLTGKGIDEESVRNFSNKVLEGKYPERQAYNAKGILVTFPTPEYKQAAIKRGTHFEEDPTRAMSNVFSAPDPITQREAPPEKEPEKKPAAKAAPQAAPQDAPIEPKTNLPVSQAPPPEDTEKSDQQPDVQAKTTAAPQQTPTPEIEPHDTEPTELPPPPEKSPAEKEADKVAIKTMLKGDDYMLEQIVGWFMYNAPEYLQEQIDTRLKKKL